MELTDLFDIKFKNHAKHNKVIVFLVGKVKRFEADMTQIKKLINEYLKLIKEYKELSVCFDMRSFDSVSMKSVWEGVSECSNNDHIIAKSIRQECFIMDNTKMIYIINTVIRIHKPIFRFKMVKTLKEAVVFMGEGMANNYIK